MVAAIGRDSPVGKRDYTMIILACVLGLRGGDTKNLRFGNFDWNKKGLPLIQHKTHKPLALPIPGAVGRAAIGYIKNGRPNFFEADIIFVKHMPPFHAFADDGHLGSRIKHYMQKAGISGHRERHSGFHSLRHSAGPIPLEMEAPLPVIANILGHPDPDVTAVYLETGLGKLAECVLTPGALPMNGQTYSSVFKTGFQGSVDTKKALGFKYDAQALAFKRIDAFFAENSLSEKTVSKEPCDKWAGKHSYGSAADRSGRISAMRAFCRYLADIGIPAYIPPKGIVRKSPRHNAHIYTDDELKSFFTAVDKSQSAPSECPCRGQVMPAFFRILYTGGMRVPELRLARIRDVNLGQGHIIVEDAKNHKDRIAPAHPALVAKCRALKESIHADSSEDEYFFMMRPGRAMPLASAYRNSRRCLDQAGISHTGHGPRIHDFRWTYCVNLLRGWADGGKTLWHTCLI